MSRHDSAKVPDGGSAPPYSYFDNSMRAPPPTYEESQRIGYPGQQTPPVPNMAHPDQYYGMISHNQQQSPLRVNMQPYNAPPPAPAVMHHGTGYGLVGPSTSAGATASQVLQVDSRAELRTTATGAVIIPPPPPGCLPTPAQLAAMQGQPVVLKQKKRSFF